MESALGIPNHVSEKYIQRILHEISLMHLKNEKSEKWTWNVVDYIQDGWDVSYYFPHVGI